MENLSKKISNVYISERERERTNRAHERRLNFYDL